MFTEQYCAPEVADWQDRRTSSDIFSLGGVFLEMVTRLNNESIDSLRNYLKEGNEFSSSAYCKSIERIRKWNSLLSGRPGRKADRLPCDWVNACLEADEKKRPTAHRLEELIEESASGVDLPFACPECASRH